MSNASAHSVVQRTSRSSRRTLARTALTAAGSLALLLSSAQSSAAQTSSTETSAPPAGAWELRFTGGAFVPTGAQRNALKDGQMSAAQLSWLVRPSLAVTGTFGWARSRDLGIVDDPKLDVFTYDVGAEARASEWFAGRRVTFSPFIGAGAGARSYNYRKLDLDATHNLAGYGAVGGELGMGRVGLRLEVRDYVAGFKPLAGAGRADTRNDVVMMVGVRFNRHRAQQD
jgi:hypothetical protein